MKVRTSYNRNNYGSVFRALILTHKPKLVVECGVLDGYSTFNIAHALRFNEHQRGIHSDFFAFDIWDEYEYKHGNKDKVHKLIDDHGLTQYVRLCRGDAFNSADIFSDNSIDFLHMDISNDGDVLLKTIKVWKDKLSSDGIIVFEGGSKERDDGWIKKYGRKPIKNELLNNPDVYENWDIQVMEPFPSLTLLWRKIK